MVLAKGSQVSLLASFANYKTKLMSFKNAQENTITHKHKSKKTDVEYRPKPASMVSPYRLKLHSKTPSQFPNELLTLDQKVSEGQVQLAYMQRGRSLFGLTEEEKQKKVC